MPPSAAGSAHVNAPELTSGVAPALHSDEGPAIGKTAITQRSIDSGAEASSTRAEASFSHASGADPFGEGSKRRRIEPSLQRSSQHPLTRTSFGSDSIKALFNSEPSATTGGQIQSNRAAIMPVSSLTTSFGPGLAQDTSGLPGPGGPVHHPGPHNAGKRAALDPVVIPGNMSRGNNVSGVPFIPQATGFMIPGLGALLKPLDLGSSKKTSVSPPSKTHALVPGSQSCNDGIASHVPGLSQQTGSGSVNTSVTQKQHKPDGGAARQSTGPQSTPLKQDPSASAVIAAADQVEKPMAQGPASPDASVTPKKMHVTTSPSGVARESEYVRPSGSPPVWKEKQTVRTFKLLRAQNNHRSFETFDGAYSILSGMNPDHYSMPYGSQVVAIKCPNLDDILMSHQTGFWATNQNVMSRIMDLHNSREDPSMKTLFLWSMPGSKHFCGLSELQAFDPKVKTEFWDKETSKWIKVQGSMMLQWKYCKLIPYEEVIPLVEGKIDQGSITQMWNGMYYTEGTGREVVKAYTEAPHVENLLAAPTIDFFRRAMENSKIATVPPMGPRSFGRGGHRGRGAYKLGRRGTFENGKTESRTQPASVPGSATKQERKDATFSTQSTTTSPEHCRDRGKPELQIMPVLRYADGSMTTAPDMTGKTVPVTHCESLAGMQTSRAERSSSLTQAQAQSFRGARSNSLVQAQTVHTVQSPRAETVDSLAQTHGSCAKNSNSLAQTQSGYTLQSSNMPPALPTPVTFDTSYSGIGDITQQKSGSVFEMAPPPKPSETQRGSASHSEHHSFNTPRTMPSSNKFFGNVDGWSYNCLTPPHAAEPKTPVSQSRSLYHLSTSPMDTSTYGTPTPQGVRLPSTPSRVGSLSTFGFGQVPEKLRTPDSSPLATRIQLAQQADSPGPASRHGHGDNDQEEDILKPHWVSMLVDNE